MICYPNANQSLLVVRTILSCLTIDVIKKINAQQNSESVAQMTHAQYTNLSTKIVIIFFVVRTYCRENIVDETNQSPWEEHLIQ